MSPPDRTYLVSGRRAISYKAKLGESHGRRACQIRELRDYLHSTTEIDASSESSSISIISIYKISLRAVDNLQHVVFISSFR